MSTQPNQDRRRVEEDGYFDGSRRYLDKRDGLITVNVHAGDCFVTQSKDEKAVTVLGSCIAACIRDPIARVGGMNHFMLPAAEGEKGQTARFGAYAMEKLINEILKRGGHKSRLEVKIFGGGNVTDSSSHVGDKNCQFVLDYLNNEGMNIAGKDIGGELPRRVHYHVATGKAFVRALKRSEDFSRVRAEEESYRKTVVTKVETPEDDIELF